MAEAAAPEAIAEEVQAVPAVATAEEVPEAEEDNNGIT